MLKICITGGPGSGKTVVMYHLMQVLEERGYHVFLVPETAQELMMNGIRPNSHITPLAFYNFVLTRQLDKERFYGSLYKFYPREKTIIIYDRGILDIGTELPRNTVAGLLQKHKLTIDAAYEQYDLVFHLVTAADGAEHFYLWNNPTNITNAANVAMESPDSAKQKDIETQSAWSGHPNLHIVQTTKSFTEKINNVINQTLLALQEPRIPSTIRRFIIKKPSTTELADLNCVFRGNVIHTYLHSNDSKIERSVVQLGTKENGFQFYYVERVDVDGDKEKFISEQRITQQEYIHYLSESNPRMMAITKSKRCFVFENRYYEIELFPFEHKYAVLDLESDVNSNSTFPPFEIIKEVTGDPSFEDIEIAKQFHLPPIETQQQSISLNSPWVYETGREEVGYGKDDVRFFGVIVTSNEKEAISAFAERGRTYLIRHRNENGIYRYQWYDKHSHMWIDDEQASSRKNN